MLLGGGTDVDAAFRWLITNSGGGDILILRASGADGYNDYIYGLGPVNSVTSIVCKSKDASYDSFVLNRIANCEGLFFAGGDQSVYWNYWKDTPVQTAVNTLINNRVTIGGTSAGMAIQPQFIYNALLNSVTSPEALLDPYTPNLTIGYNFLDLKLLLNVITDTHFYQRDRMGRSIAFLARLLADGLATGNARGIACDEATAVIISESGEGRVISLNNNIAYFLESTQPPTVCEPGVPLEFSSVNVIAVSNNGIFDLNSWSALAGREYQLSAANGQLTSIGNNGNIY
jgi:cyanophycinase-like exopeptidase